MNLIILVLFTQLAVVYLDNYSNINLFFNNLKANKTAHAYTSRTRLLLFTRTLFFITPPILGYIVINEPFFKILMLFFLACLITFFVTFLQYVFFFKQIKLAFFSHLAMFAFKNYKNIYLYIGLIAFSIFLISPFLVNFIAAIFPKQALFLVQMNPIITSVSTFYVVLYMDPKISKSVDLDRDVQDELIESVFVRLVGRFLITIVALVCIIYFARLT